MNSPNPPSPHRLYWAPVLVVIGFVLAFALVVPASLWKASTHGALWLATLFGAFVGATEVANRYHDEPFRACRSPFGLIYIFANGALSLGAALMIYHYRDGFGALAKDAFGVAIAAGFGSAAVMRSKIVTLKGADKKDITVGPDAFVQMALKTIDHQVDRFRAARRLQIVMSALPTIRSFGTFSDAGQYLSASLLAFQNLDQTHRDALAAVVNGYNSEADLPEDLKYLGLSFLFLTIVGEAQFDAVLQRAKDVKFKSQAAGGNPGPGGGAVGGGSTPPKP
jgi:hypothetical protein